MGISSEEVKNTFFHKLISIIKQALIWSAAAAAAGLLFGLINGNILQAINRFIYAAAMLLLAYTIIPAEELRAFVVNKKRIVNAQEAEELRRGKRERMNLQLWSFLRTSVVFLVAIIMELIRFKI